jgi:hypothetical protein
VALSGLAGSALAGISPARALDREAPRDIAVTAYPFAAFQSGDRERRIFGKLTFLGGLELKSKDPEFGGISSAQIDPDGRGFIAITDHAHWFTGRFTEEGGVLTGIERARLAPMIAPGGGRMKHSRYFDSEGLARRGNQLFVSVERTHDILQFDAASFPTGRGRPIEVPAEMKALGGNRGIEGLGVLPRESAFAGSLIALAERAPRGSATHDSPAFIFGPRGGALAIRKIGDFDVTDVNFLPGGDMLVLERRFVPIFGIGFRIRRIPIAMVRPGAVLDGAVLIEADLSHQIDNMEALMVHRAADGRAILTLMSDDNFSLLQRTLVLRFALNE